MSFKLEFSTIKELKIFMALFYRGNEEFIKKEVALLDKGTDDLENALENANKEM